MIFNKVIFLGSFQFFLEVYLIFNLLVSRYEKKKFYYIKQVGFILLASLLNVLPTIRIGFFNYTYLVSVLLCIVFGFFLYKLKILDLIAHAFASFALQNIQSNVLVLSTFNDAVDIEKNIAILIYFVIYFSFYGLYAFIFCYLLRKIEIKANWIICITSSIIIILNIVLSQYVSGLKNLDPIYIIYEIMCNLFALILHYGICVISANIIKKKDLEQEKNILLQMFHEQEKIHKTSKETVDIINHKCHDLKHQIFALNSMNENDRSEQLKKIEKSINIYDSIAKTGNETLDLILTEKNLLCNSKNITLKYLVDITCLDGIEQIDIWTIFGNAIDNAIEALEKEDKEKRIININICWKNKMRYIEIDNYTSANVVFKNGFPLTSKKDKNYHGFGVKSIDNIVKKYQGVCKSEIEDSIFKLKIII